MLKAIFVACALATTGVVTPSMAQDIEPFVIVPDGPGGGGPGLGGGGFFPGGGGGGNAVTTSGLNVRSGPGTRYAIIDVLSRGDAVRIESCSGGWCWINHRGPSGWVSENHLSRTGGGGGDGSTVRPRREACFYDQPFFRGRSFCALPGESDRNLGSWNNRIASISVRGFPTVQVCTGRDFNGCDAFNQDTAQLPRWLEWNISSFRVFH